MYFIASWICIVYYNTLLICKIIVTYVSNTIIKIIDLSYVEHVNCERG